MKYFLLISFIFFICNLSAQQRNDSLAQQLDRIRSYDQEYRAQLNIIQQKFASDTIALSRQLDTLFTKMKMTDSTNLIAIEQILKKYGWPAPDIVGTERSATVFLVIQHSGLATQKQYLPLVREAVKQKKIKPSDLALLEDRIALKEGRKQIYGTQVSWNIKLNTYTMIRLEDPDNVDKRRAEIGLPPLDIYLQSCCNIKWNVTEYKNAEQEKK